MIDLRSDTITLPTEEMREAMHRAELGDDSREGDPTVRRLEDTAATMTGKAGSWNRAVVKVERPGPLHFPAVAGVELKNIYFRDGTK